MATMLPESRRAVLDAILKVKDFALNFLTEFVAGLSTETRLRRKGRGETSGETLPGPPLMGNSSGPAGQQRYRPKHPMIAGAITGGIEICLTYPLEYAKCQLQLAELARGPAAHGAGRAAGSAGAGSAGASLLGVVRDTVRARGPLGLYSGLSPWYAYLEVVLVRAPDCSFARHRSVPSLAIDLCHPPLPSVCLFHRPRL